MLTTPKHSYGFMYINLNNFRIVGDIFVLLYFIYYSSNKTEEKNVDAQKIFFVVVLLTFLTWLNHEQDFTKRISNSISAPDILVSTANLAQQFTLIAHTKRFVFFWTLAVQCMYFYFNWNRTSSCHWISTQRNVSILHNT